MDTFWHTLAKTRRNSEKAKILQKSKKLMDCSDFKFPNLAH